MGDHVGVGVPVETPFVGDLDAAEKQRPVRPEAVAVVADPDPGRHPIGSIRRSRASKTASSLIADVAEELHRAIVFVADLLRQVGVGGEREGNARVGQHLAKRRRRVELVDWLAQAGGRDLDRDPGLGDRFDRGLVVVARITRGAGPSRAPDLDQVGVGEYVEEPTASRLGEVLEVALPDPVGVAALELPDIPAVLVDCALTDEVDRADHVVEVPCLE